MFLIADRLGNDLLAGHNMKDGKYDVVKGSFSDKQNWSDDSHRLAPHRQRYVSSLNAKQTLG